MATLTIRLPDNKHERLKALASYKKVSVNKLVEELSTQALAEFDSEIRFRALASAGNIKKGLAYLKKLDKMPKQIVMIDDKMSHVKNIAETLEPLGISFIGIRYGGADEKVKAFNPKIAEIQLEHFQKILSDEQALHLMQFTADN